MEFEGGIPRQDSLVIVEELESNTIILHFFTDRVLPERIPSFLVEHICFFRRVGHYHTILVCFLLQAGFDCANYSLSFLEH